jgi:membrane dipeptidase
MSMTMDSSLTDAAKVHHEALVLDAASFFCKGYDANLEASGITSLNIMVPWPSDDFETALRRLEEYYELVALDSSLKIALRAEDITEAKSNGQLALVLGTQNARLISDRLIRLETMVRLGFRYMQLTYNERNFIGDGCAEPNDAGLSRFGRDVVQAMPAVGLVMDLTHAGHRTAMEALKLATVPAIISHANPRSLYDNPRNVYDDVIRALADTGGVLGCTLPSPFNWPGGESLPTIANFVRAIEYVIDLVGEDHVSIGSDLVATAGAYPPDLSKQLRPDLYAVSGTFYAKFGVEKHVRKVQGISAIEDYPKLTHALLSRGHSVSTVKKILGENLLRVYRTVWKF